MKIVVHHALGAGNFDHRSKFGMRVALDRIPWSCESARILDMYVDFECLAAIDDPVSFDNMKFVSMRRTKIVDPGLVVHSNCIDNQYIAFVMAYRFAKP